MFATSVRVRPCSARSSPRSVGRVTLRTPSSCSSCMRTGTCCSSTPSGPLTFTWLPGDTSMVTPLGTSMGFRPILLMALPDEREHFAANAALRGLTAGDHAGRGGQDGGAETTEDARKPVLAGIDTPAGLRDALQVGDHALAIAAELELDDERGERGAFDDPEVLDVALVLEEACDLLLHPRGRHLGGVVHRLVGVADAGQHVCDWISEHFSSRKMLDGRDNCRLEQSRISSLEYGASSSPGTLGHAWDRALMRELAQADPAQLELLVDGTRAAAPVAPRVRLRLVLRRPLLLDAE